MACYEYEQTLNTALHEIAVSLKALANAVNKSLPSEEIVTNPLKPYWDEKRQAVHVPVIDKFVDAKRLSNEKFLGSDIVKFARNAGKELPSKRDMFALLLFKDEINAIISKHGGDILEDWEWSSECMDGFVCVADFNNGCVLSSAYRNSRYYARAISA